MEDRDTDLKTELDPKAPPLLMATARPGEVEIGPTLLPGDIVEKITMQQGETLDEALERQGWRRTLDWNGRSVGSWTLVVKVTEVDS